MKLRQYGKGACCDYHSESASISEGSIEPIDYTISAEERHAKATDIGYCDKRPFGWVAMYLEADTLILQIDKQKWDIGNDSTSMLYGYNFLDQTKYEVIFSIKDIEKEFDARYERWWEPMGDELVDPVTAYEDLDNKDNDLLAFACYLKNNQISLKNMVRTYQKRALRSQIQD